MIEEIALTCTCFETKNAELRQRGFALTASHHSETGQPIPVLKVETAATLLGAPIGEIIITAAYCPFCGTRYEPDSFEGLPLRTS